MTNSSGTVVAEQNFDAWGRKRNPTNWTYVSIPAVPAWLYRGFTGHEHLPQFTLINMNGRLYDPIVGRMLSTDNNVQMPDFTQNYNRYSYALNNPLRFTDPDGEFIFLAFAIGILATAIQASQGNIGGPADFFGTFALNAGAAYVGAGVSSGISASLAGSSFGAGFAGTAATSSTGFVMSAIAGAGGGFAGGFISSTGNELLNGQSFLSSLKSGVNSGLMGFAVGGVIGGITGGIHAVRHSRNFWTGNFKTVKIPAAYYADLNSTSGSEYDFNAFGEDSGPYLQNYSGHDVYYRPEDGFRGMTWRLSHGEQLPLTARVDGVATFKSTTTDQVFKVADGGKISVIGGGEIAYRNASKLWPSIPGTRFQYGWLGRDFFISNNFFDGAEGWGRLFEQIRFIR